MKTSITKIVAILAFILININFAQAQTEKLKVDLSKIKYNKSLTIPVLNFQRSSVRAIRAFEKPASNDVNEDSEPTGPDSAISPTYLADRFEAVSRNIRDDFDNHIPYSDEIFRDHSSLNNYYYYPSGYLLKRDTIDGYDINFLHRTRSEDSDEEKIILTFTLATRQLDGGIPLISALAEFAIKPMNNKPVILNRLPISSVKVSLAGLGSLIDQQQIQVINTPHKVGDDIRVQATMNQSQKEDVVASIRSGGMSGDITFTTNNDSFELVIPYFVSFTDYTGEWISDVTNISTTDTIKNTSPFPIAMTGVVAYVKPRSGSKLIRYTMPLREPVIMEPGAAARADKSYRQLFASYGQMISTWATFERISCEECMNEIERDILVSPAVASRTELPIEVIPNVFEQFSLFKILVEVRSSFFSSSASYEEVKTFTLRPDETNKTTDLYINRDDGDDVVPFQFRLKPLHLEGISTQFSDWKTSDGVMDITITAGDIRPLITTTEDEDDY
jgi:hypothetical protein